MINHWPTRVICSNRSSAKHAEQFLASLESSKFELGFSRECFFQLSTTVMRRATLIPRYGLPREQRGQNIEAHTIHQPVTAARLEITFPSQQMAAAVSRVLNDKLEYYYGRSASISAEIMRHSINIYGQESRVVSINLSDLSKNQLSDLRAIFSDCKALIRQICQQQLSLPSRPGSMGTQPSINKIDRPGVDDHTGVPFNEEDLRFAFALHDYIGSEASRQSGLRFDTDGTGRITRIDLLNLTRGVSRAEFAVIQKVDQLSGRVQDPELRISTTWDAAEIDKMKKNPHFCL